jgi:exodeoxyribonuclease VII large subunit
MWDEMPGRERQAMPTGDTPLHASSVDSRVQAWGVAALLLAANDQLVARFGALSVAGEISGFNRAPSGHCYFSLKDIGGADAMLRCAMFRRAAQLTPFEPGNGQQVELRGRLAVYEARGELQMVVEAMRAVGAGALHEQFLRLKAQLAAQGLFDSQRKRAPTAYPKAVGIVTSLGAAALRDVLVTLARRAPHVRVVVYPCGVQGAAAPASIVQALATASARAEVDTLLLCRGGGSLEDLWAFNDERVVRAVAALPMPVIGAIGHETDVTLAELAADVRAATPTAAAELCAVAKGEAAGRLQTLSQLLSQRLQARLRGQAQTLDRLSLRLGRPAAWLGAQQAQLDGWQRRAQASLVGRLGTDRMRLQTLGARLRGEPARIVATQRLKLAALESTLRALDPALVLARGYAWVEGADHKPIASVRSLAPGTRIALVLHDGRASADVVDVAPHQPAKPVKTTRRPRRPGAST